MEIRTKRLIASDWTPDLTGARRAALDAAVAEILTPSVLAPLPPAVQSLDHGVSGWIDRQAGLAQVLAVRSRDTASLLGLAMVMPTDPETRHIGYLLAEHAWGRGYATELVKGLVAALVDDGAVTLGAGVARDNPASARVLAKAGFVPDGDPAGDTLHFVRHS